LNNLLTLEHYNPDAIQDIPDQRPHLACKQKRYAGRLLP